MTRARPSAGDLSRVRRRKPCLPDLAFTLGPVHLFPVRCLNREPSRYPNGEGCQASLSNSQAAAQHLGGVSEGDRTGRADRVSRENSSGESVTQPVGRGGQPTEPAGAAGVVGVPRSSDDPPESKTGGERRRGTLALCLSPRPLRLLYSMSSYFLKRLREAIPDDLQDSQ